MSTIAVVGAGVAGLTVAYGLRGRPAEVTIFEKSRGFGGRAATRGRHGCRYDHGAPYFSPSSERVERLVTAHLPTEHLLAIGPVGTFDEDGTCRVGAPDAAQGPKWTYVQGISTLGKLLARQCRAAVRRNTRIERLEREGDRWRLHTESGERTAPYDAVVLTAPAPQSVALLRSVSADQKGIRRVRAGLESVRYAPQFAYVLAYDRPIERPVDAFGLRGPGPGHPLDWIGFESDKPGHAPAGQTLLVVHTAEEWTASRVDREPDAFLSEVTDAAEEVLSASLRPSDWHDTHRWRYARPRAAGGLDPALGAEDGIVLAGDAVAGRGTVAGAIESGFDAAARLRDSLAQ